MTTNQRAGVGRVAMGLGLIGVLAAGGAAWIFFARVAPKTSEATASRSDRIDDRSSLDAIAASLKSGSGMALAVLQQRLAIKPGESPTPIPEGESNAWQSVAGGVRAAYARYSPYGRASAVVVAVRVLEKLATHPAPADWANCLGPMFDVLVAGISDADPSVRAAALQETGRLWQWSPGRELTLTAEIEYVSAWKQSIYNQVLRALKDPNASVRARAVGCLAALPLDDKSAPAVALLQQRRPETDEVESDEVRLAVLSGFANRRALLDEELIVALLYDKSLPVANAAEEVLKYRGLTGEQIGLCKLLVHPMPHMRISVIPMLQARTDIDPTIWLVFLSRDEDESVRTKAVEALGQSESQEARDRLSEMAAKDESPAVRQAAAQVAPPVDSETTAALPPLPGSVGLNPKAN